VTGPTLSVVIPAYMNARTIEETVDSVLSQTGVDFELVVADHASTDGTREVLQQYAPDDRVRLLDTPAGGGAPRNWNRVTAEATGTYLKLVCGDDLLRPGVLARQVDLLSSTGATLTACRRDIIDMRGNVLFAGWGLHGLSQPMSGAKAIRKAVRAGSNLFGEPASVTMRRDALEAAGGWFDAFPYLIDQATYSRVLVDGTFVPDPEIGATFRMSDTQWSVALTNAQSAQARAFHRWMRSQHPYVVGGADRVIGDVRASIMARARRMSYALLKRRMR